MSLLRTNAILISAALTLLFTSLGFAQSKRMVLIEEATNASCGPCAAQNPTFHYWMSGEQFKDRVIPLVFRANWPGPDVMNAANAYMHDTRIVTYYNISGVPSARVSGKIAPRVNPDIYEGAPYDTAALSAAVKALPEESPINITLVQSENGNTIDADVTVMSTTALSNHYLRIVLVEGFHYYPNAGTNGEKEFHWIAREMMPAPEGIQISLVANEPKNFKQSFTIDPEWNRNQMYLIAFVQNDGTKEVLQAATTKEELEVSALGSTVALDKTPNQPHEFALELHTGYAGNYSASVMTKALPQGWSAEVLMNGTALDSGETVSLGADVTVPITIRMNPVDSKRRDGSVIVGFEGPRASYVLDTFKLFSHNITVPTLVRDEGNPLIADYYAAAFEKGTLTYAMINRGEEGLFNLNDYPVLLCESGKFGLKAEDGALLKNYIDNRGRLYMIGAEIAWGLADDSAVNWPDYYLDVPFLNNYLKAEYVRDANPARSSRGFPGDPVGDGVGVNFGGGIQNQDTPDEIRPLDGAIACLYYGTNQNEIAGIRYAGNGYALVYIGFGLEGISNATHRGNLLAKGLNWLLSVNSTGPDLAAPQATTLTVFPNPSNGAFTVNVNLAAAAQVEVTLHDLLGREVAVHKSVFLGAGENSVSLDAKGLLPGTYLVKTLVNGTTHTSMVSVVR